MTMTMMDASMFIVFTIEEYTSLKPLPIPAGYIAVKTERKRNEVYVTLRKQMIHPFYAPESIVMDETLPAFEARRYSNGYLLYRDNDKDLSGIPNTAQPVRSWKTHRAKQWAKGSSRRRKFGRNYPKFEEKIWIGVGNSNLSKLMRALGLE